MKCINCYREIDDGLKFCPKCGFMQPDDRESYEREHPELADAMPDEEILRQVNMLPNAPRTAMTRDEFAQFLADDPLADSIIDIADDGLEIYGLKQPAAIQSWYAKCGELIGDKQGFYPYFVQLFSQQPETACNLLHSQVAYSLNLSLPQQEPTPSVSQPTLPAKPQQTEASQPPTLSQQSSQSWTQARRATYDPQPPDGEYTYPRYNYNKNDKESSNSALYAIIGLLVILIIGLVIYLFSRDKKGSSHNYSELDESYEYSSPIAASSEDNDTSYIETIPVQEEPYTDESYEDDSEMQLSVFVVSSVRGTGACLRESPTTSSKALSVYSDGTYFDGYYSDVYPWIAVVENGSIIGYIHDENVTSY